MRRSWSSRSLRRASSPLPVLSAPIPPPRGRLRRTISTPSMCFQSWSVSEVPKSPTRTPTPPYRRPDPAIVLSATETREIAKAKESSSPEKAFKDWDPDLLSRSTQTELLAEGSTQTESLSCLKDDELLQNEGPRFAVRRFLGVQWNKSFLVSLAILAAVVFTVAVIATLSGTSNANKNIDSLDLAPDGFESEQASAHKEAAVTAASTVRRTMTVRRMKAVGKVRTSKRAAIKARKKARASQRTDKNRAKKHHTRLPTTRPSARKLAKSRRLPRTVTTSRRKSGKGKVSGSRRSPKGNLHLVTGKGRTTTTISNEEEVSAGNDLAEESEEPQESPTAPSQAE